MSEATFLQHFTNVTIIIIVLQHNTILTINLLSDRANYCGYCMPNPNPK